MEPKPEQPSELARELLLGAAIFALAIAALCIAAAAPPRRRQAPDGERRRLRDRVAELEAAERELAAEVEDACEVAFVAIAVAAADEARERQEPEPGGHAPP